MNFLHMKSEEKAGLRITVIFHLVVLIVLLLYGIGTEIMPENSFVLDFSKQEEKEQVEKQEKLEEEISKKLDRMIDKARTENPVKNVIVSKNLSDDRHSAAEAEQLMSDAARLAAELKGGYKDAIEEDAREETVDISPKKEKGPQAEYKGPSVLSWTLEGRKATHLPIPAYRCYGAGSVTVVIVVDQQGNVLNAKISDAESAEDKCLRDFAIRAARLSKFNRDMKAPVRQAGEIVYSFVAQ